MLNKKENAFGLMAARAILIIWKYIDRKNRLDICHFFKLREKVKNRYAVFHAYSPKP